MKIMRDTIYVSREGKLYQWLGEKSTVGTGSEKCELYKLTPVGQGDRRPQFEEWLTSEGKWFLQAKDGIVSDRDLVGVTSWA